MGPTISETSTHAADNAKTVPQKIQKGSSSGSNQTFLRCDRRPQLGHVRGGDSAHSRSECMQRPMRCPLAHSPWMASTIGTSLLQMGHSSATTVSPKSLTSSSLGTLPMMISHSANRRRELLCCSSRSPSKLRTTM